MTALKARGSLVLALSAMILVACSSNTNNATPTSDATSAPSSSAAPTSAVPAPTSNTVEVDAAKELRAALEKSILAGKESGLTEVWSDSEGIAALIVAWSPDRAISSTYDIEAAEGEIGDFEYTTPAVALADLDSLEAGDYEGGVVSKSASGDYIMQLTFEGDVYLSTYRLNADGLVESGESYIADELLGSMVLRYEITEDGQTALDAV